MNWERTTASKLVQKYLATARFCDISLMITGLLQAFFEVFAE
jgi:hypothetical protein